MRLTKHHGLGNDFLVALLPQVPDGAADLARRLCDRHRGLGADGMILGTPVTPGEAAAGAGIGFRLFNADGSPAEVSGNGLRCFAQALALDRGEAMLEIVAATPAGPRRLTLHPTGDPLVADASVEMGTVTDGPGVRGDLEGVPGLPAVRRAATGDIGNPHLVLLVDDPGAADLAVLGPVLEARYGGINVHVVAPGDAPGVLRVSTWERGAGLTLACGSGACVSAARARDWGLVGDEVTVHMPGGVARVRLGDPVVLTGPTTFIAAIEVPDARI
jgi:diaminopimelate epimerase